MSDIIQSIEVSFLAMGVIFLVLGLLIVVVRILVNLIPYQAPAAPAPKTPAAKPSAPTGTAPEEEHIAAIHAALAHHLGRAPHEIHIQSVTSL